MARLLRTIVPSLSGGYQPEAEGEKKFADLHNADLDQDNEGNGDDVYKASKIKKYDRKKDRMGNEPGEDEKDYKRHNKTAKGFCHDEDDEKNEVDEETTTEQIKARKKEDTNHRDNTPVHPNVLAANIKNLKLRSAKTQNQIDDRKKEDTNHYKKHYNEESEVDADEKKLLKTHLKHDKKYHTAELEGNEKTANKEKKISMKAEKAIDKEADEHKKEQNESAVLAYNNWEKDNIDSLPRSTDRTNWREKFKFARTLRKKAERQDAHSADTFDVRNLNKEEKINEVYYINHPDHRHKKFHNYNELAAYAAQQHLDPVKLKTFIRNEEVNLDEISSDLAHRYADKATKQAVHVANKLTSFSNPNHNPDRESQLKTVNKRLKGFSNARKRFGDTKDTTQDSGMMKDKFKDETNG